MTRAARQRLRIAAYVGVFTAWGLASYIIAGHLGV